MNIKIEDINDTRKKLLVSVGADEVEKEHDELVKEFARMARIPGFRPGKAPLPMVAKRYSKELNEELNKKIVSRSYRHALEESKLVPFSVIEVSDGQIRRGEENEVSIVLDVKPDFDLPEYKGLTIKKGSEEVSEEDIDRVIQEIRSQRASFTQVERETRPGDYVKLSYTGKVDGQPIAELVADKPILSQQSATWEEVGSQEAAIPGFPAALAGLKKEEKKEVQVQFPDDFDEEALRGKAATYEVEIFEVREKELPELNEELLKALGVSSVEDLRNRIKEDLGRQKKQENHSRKRQQITEQLAAGAEFPLPESALEQETESILRQFLQENIRRGVDQQEFESRKEELYEGARKGALHRVKVQMILAKIAEAEKIEVTDEDLSRYVYFEAMRRREKPEKLVRELRKNPDEVDSIRQGLLFDKTLDFLLEKATLSETES